MDWKTLAAAGILLAGTGAAEAAEPTKFELTTFGDLVDVCSDQDELAAQFCRGWITGTGQLYYELAAASVVPPLACADPIPSLDRIRQAIVAFAATNPASRNEKATDGFWHASSVIWPCKK